MPGRTLDTKKRRVFNSVFGTPPISQPTPVTTPITGFTAPGQAFGAPPLHNDTFSSQLSSPSKLSPPGTDHVQDQVRWDRSWHIATRVLNLPDFAEHRGVLEPLKPERESVGKDFYQALNVLIYPQTYVPLARQTEDIIAWHTSQVRRHFLRQVLPIILRLKKHEKPDAILLRVVKVLETAQRQYLHGLSFIKEHIDNSGLPGTSTPVVSRFRRDVYAVISNSVTEPILDILTKVLTSQVSYILGLSSPNGSTYSVVPEDAESERSRREILGLVESLKNVGLAGEQFQVTFAEVMNDSMTEYVNRGCKGIWSQLDLSGSQSSNETILPRTAHHPSPSRCVRDLCEWIENRYAKLAVQVLNMLDTKFNISWTDKEKYKEMSIGRLAELRINELYDIVVNWPHSRGALDDLRTAITTPQRRLHLTEVFAKTLSEKLLHPGASTLRILQTYISMIWSFHALDHSKVLLDRVAYPLQLYLCSREDTVRIIIAGLLSDTEDAQDNPITSSTDKLVELAQLLNKGSEQVGSRADDEELDWHDTEWIPDPVDAGPGYKRSKNADIIGTLIGVLGSQEVFIKEFQNIMGENLLKHDGSFEKEIKVLELLKVRFGEAPLQACEVMLKDIQDSGRVNSVIRKKQNLDSHGSENDAQILGAGSIADSQSKPSLHAKILSRLFWPQLHDEEYQVPNEIMELQEAYEEGFESIKASRKLTWLHALGQATVELQLEDRIIVEEVHTWQATVIYAFQSEDENIQRTTEELVTELGMDETLVRSALKFWVNKLVLHETSPNTYSVLETLNQEDRARSNAQASAPSSSNKDDSLDDDTGLGSSDGIGKEKMGMYWQFIQGMLKNSSSQMSLPQIAMMLKMLIVDGFPYSNEELQEFLGRKVQDGSLEVVSGKYKLKK
ncbi:related to component of the anaphase promoting complex [Phialocephala subalpina]|uniref:Anaphase-promoting complex subunit 2 n=1 Tax=Phialocephala subalpina TaxID=576137 RepID=A0A1L7WCT0_9HELO|nr:related to component of the anaphase promoting complex [Phialocephala subalpina]